MNPFSCKALGPVQLTCQSIFPKPPNSPSVVSNLHIAHGLLGNSNNWMTAAKRLVQHPFLVKKVHGAFALDMRNHGTSPHLPIHCNAALASDLEGVILNSQRSINSVTNTIAQHSVLIGHSMGGLAVMGLLLRRYNEKAIFDSLAVNEEEKGDDSAGTFGKWSFAQRQECAAAMEAVNESFGFSRNEPLRDVIFYDPNALKGENNSLSFPPGASSPPLHGRISACVIVDITPTDDFRKDVQSDNDIFRTMDCMTKVDLSVIQNYNDIQKELIRVGITEKDMRGFIATNIVLNSKEKGGAASWRCNLPILVDFYSEFAPNIVQWFDNKDVMKHKRQNGIEPQPCTLPILFVFGENSPFNNSAQRKRLKKFFPNLQEVVVEGSGHFVHYEKMEAFVEATSPFISEHLQK
ncbi:unnamed protein product [Phytomonas sp. Hart1]|nr:unnamed protein product [Phytomonas sp. Hart1]|eukprot:CCW66781.1 unnamed protein product [Phytomonas sp. isolate Hart1]